MNKQSSVGLTEELLTNLINTVALEYHFRLTVEKYYSLLYVKGTSDEAVRGSLTKKLQFAKETLERTTEQRRSVMRALQSLSTEDANPDLWCSLKHASVQMITAFEAWQVDMNNAEVEEIYHSAVELFNVVVAGFLGFYPQPCSACFADSIRSQEEMNEIMSNVESKSEDMSEEAVMARAVEVFGNVPDSVLETN
ncbi:hypothetical protein [Clostridium sp.]|uniref:hypothetical protein n=1 Tax=Clostridium sp. TaxID=1506 RepID=UPI00290937F6|nr:hypothetical protein [Clostridium sp.]MDU7005350.1 hypothetical protein [Clostridium sp.]